MYRPPRVIGRALFIIALLGCTGAALVESIRETWMPLEGYALVANQQSASASLIDLRRDSARTIPVGVGPHEAAISPSGRIGVVTIYGQQPAGNELAIIDIRTAAVTKTVSLGEYTRPHGVVFLAGNESRVVVTSEATQRLLVVNIETGQVESAIPTNANGSHMAGVTADGKRAFTANIGSGSVSEIDLVERKFVRTVPVGPRPEGIAVTPDGKEVWAGSNTDGTVSIVETATGQVAAKLSGFTLPYRLAISADGRTAIICDPQANRIAIADVAMRRVIWDVTELGSPRGVTITPDGAFALVTVAADPSMAVVDLKAKKVVGRVPVGASPDGVGFGPLSR